MLLGQVDGGVDHLLMALLLALRDGAAGAAEQARDPVAGGVLHHLAALLGEVPNCRIFTAIKLKLKLGEVPGGARHLGVVSTLLQSLSGAALLQGPVALPHLGYICFLSFCFFIFWVIFFFFLYILGYIAIVSKFESPPSPSDSG